jgi:hypothetical protein
MSLALLQLAIGWPGAAPHWQATLRIAWGNFATFVAWSDLAAALLTFLFVIVFVRVAGRVHHAKQLEREHKVLPFA